jgi:hypothetical protein
MRSTKQQCATIREAAEDGAGLFAFGSRADDTWRRRDVENFIGSFERLRRLGRSAP